MQPQKSLGDKPEAMGNSSTQRIARALQQSNILDFNTLRDLTEGRHGRHDMACPVCGPGRRSKANQNRAVLRVYALDADFLTYNCVRCEAQGFAHRTGQTRVNPEVIRRARATAVAQDEGYALKQRRKAQYLYAVSEPNSGSIVERYLLEARGLSCPLPPVLRFLRPQKAEHHPAMVAAFGLPTEAEPGLYRIQARDIHGVHLTFLKPDGSGRAQTEDAKSKIIIGPSLGFPIALVPPNDLQGMAVAEGIEDALSVYEATGLGAWAAGSAGRLGALANTIPDNVEHVSVLQDTDEAGARGSSTLAARLQRRGIETCVISVGVKDATA